MFVRLQDHGVQINPAKCVLGAAFLEFLGHHVGKEGIQPLKERVWAVQEYPLPSTQRELKKFLGLINLYHCFIPGCTNILQPLHSLLSDDAKKNGLLAWTDDSTKAFEGIKDALANASLLYHPQPNAPTCIVTNASDVAIGAVLQQWEQAQWCPIAYFSRKLTVTERRYSTFDWELLMIYKAVKHFRYFIEGRQFHIATDHKPITFALSSRSEQHSRRKVHHLDYIAQFTNDIRHIKGTANMAADTLSRVKIDGLWATGTPPRLDFQL